MKQNAIAEVAAGAAFVCGCLLPGATEAACGGDRLRIEALRAKRLISLIRPENTASRRGKDGDAREKRFLGFTHVVYAIGTPGAMPLAWHARRE